MKKLLKVQDGVIQSTDFSEGVPSLWILNPSNANLLFTHPGVKIINSVSSQSFLKAIDYEKCIIDISNTFNPQNASEKAIISIFENSDTSIEIEEYYDSVQGTANTYPYFRIVKSYNKYSFYWSNDKISWTYIGGTEIIMTSPKLKIELVGGGSAEYILNSVKIYKDSIVKINGVTEGQIVKLYQNSTEVLSKTTTFGNSHVDLDISNFENLTFDIKVFDTDGITQLTSETGKLLCGGDIYSFTQFITLLDENNNQIEPLFMKNLGAIPGDYVEHKLKIVNDSGAVFNQIDIQLKAIDGGTINQYVRIAKDIGGSPGVYDTYQTYTSIEIGGERSFWVRIMKAYGDPSISEIDFRIDITTS